jgi:hypothetical protein
LSGEGGVFLKFFKSQVIDIERVTPAPGGSLPLGHIVCLKIEQNKVKIFLDVTN